MAQTTGSCLCGACKISFEGEPQFMALCHCQICQKVSGGPFTANLLVPEAALTSTGPLKVYLNTRTGSGQPTRGYFCPECSCLMYGIAESSPGMAAVKPGILDGGAASKYTPSAEINAEHKAKWVPVLEGTQVFQKMPGME